MKSKQKWNRIEIRKGWNKSEKNQKFKNEIEMKLN